MALTIDDLTDGRAEKNVPLLPELNLADITDDTPFEIGEIVPFYENNPGRVDYRSQVNIHGYGSGMNDDYLVVSGTPDLPPGFVKAIPFGCIATYRRVGAFQPEDGY